MLTPEVFNIAYHAIQNRDSFEMVINEGTTLKGSSVVGRDGWQYIIPNSIAWEFLNTEYECGTLRYVFFVNEVPVSFEGGFGLLTIPVDCFQNTPPNFLEARWNGLDVVLDLTSPIANGV